MAYIRRIIARSVRNVRSLDIDLTPPPGVESGSMPRHLILTGQNGSGKSGILHAIDEEERSFNHSNVGGGMAQLLQPIQALTVAEQEAALAAKSELIEAATGLGCLWGPERIRRDSRSIFSFHGASR